MTEEDLINLVEAGIGFIYLTYNGGGDSGAIEEIVAISNTCEKAKKIWESKDEMLPMYIGESMDIDLETFPVSVSMQDIEDMCYKHLNHIEDWWNNDGGYGSMLIEIPSLKFRNNNAVHYTQTDYYSHDGELETKEMFK